MGSNNPLDLILDFIEALILLFERAGIVIITLLVAIIVFSVLGATIKGFVPNLDPDILKVLFDRALNFIKYNPIIDLFVALCAIIGGFIAKIRDWI